MLKKAAPTRQKLQMRLKIMKSIRKSYFEFSKFSAKANKGKDVT